MNGALYHFIFFVISVGSALYSFGKLRGIGEIQPRDLGKMKDFWLLSAAAWMAAIGIAVSSINVLFTL